jgi:hypothetical protein
MIPCGLAVEAAEWVGQPQNGLDILGCLLLPSYSPDGTPEMPAAHTLSIPTRTRQSWMASCRQDPAVSSSLGMVTRVVGTFQASLWPQLGERLPPSSPPRMTKESSQVLVSQALREASGECFAYGQ